MLGIVLSAFQALNPQQLNEADTVTVLIIQMRKMKVYSLTRDTYASSKWRRGRNDPGSPAQAYMLERANSAPSHAGEDRLLWLIGGHPWTARPKEPAL